MKNIAIIGTAGRDRRPELTKKLWWEMLKDASSWFTHPNQYKLVSGGAAWADHLAVELYLLSPEIFHLELFLPAPLNEDGIFEGGRATAGSISNWYHEMFSDVVKFDSRKRILMARDWGAKIHQGEVGPPTRFFERNADVAKAATDGVLAYTWGEGKEPADGGTKHTWGLCSGRKIHVPLDRLHAKIQTKQAQAAT